MTQFNEEETKTLNKNIRKISYSLRQELKKIENNINIYVNSDFFESDSDDLQYKIKDNMNQNILSELNTFSKKFKLNQEIYSQKCKELIIEDEEENLYEMNDISTTSSELNENVKNGENFLMKEEPDLLLQSRENELNEIVKGVNNLQELFKDLHILVVEQGTILDRIDYNIDIGYDNISKGKKKIVSANEKHKSSCFRNVILFLLLCIFIESILILFKIF
jgi:syntaxin 16